jgi:hypothetical protein
MSQTSSLVAVGDQTPEASQMTDITSAPDSSRRRKVTIVGLSLVLVLLLGIVAGGVWLRWRRAQAGNSLFDMFSAMQTATGEIGRGLMDGTKVSAGFVADLRAKRWDEAYQHTSKGFRQRVDEASFERLVKDSPALKGPNTSINFNVLMTSGGASITFNGGGVAPKGGVWLLLVGEEGTLKVDRMALEDKTIP